MSALLAGVYDRLLAAYGPQDWWPGHRGGPLEICVGAVLTQSCAWSNVEKALDSLRAADSLTLPALLAMPEAELARHIFSCGYFNVKARKVKAFVRHVHERHAGDLAAMMRQPEEALRAELLSIYGIGEETADDIMLYVADRPYFVVDAYTRRLVERLGVGRAQGSYAEVQAFFHAHVPRETARYNEFHALIVMLGKNVCRKAPRCAECPVREVCPTGRATGG